MFFYTPLGKNSLSGWWVSEMIYEFKSNEEYEKWLRLQSYGTKEKAKKFAEMFPNTIPVVLQVDAFTPQGGEWAPAYVFVHPQFAGLLRWAIVE